MKTNYTIAIVGRPNVGKSTLFNRLIGRFRAIVEDRPGITRDRLYGKTSLLGHEIAVIDTGGLFLNPKTDLERQMTAQAFTAMTEADVIVVVMDGREGMNPYDGDWVKKLRRLNKPKIYLINKIDHDRHVGLSHDFFALGVSPLIPISAQTERNFSLFQEEILKQLGISGAKKAPVEDESSREVPKISIIGRPNVGKSTLFNVLLGSERSIVTPEPGTTRDCLDTQLFFGDSSYIFMDTAGIRRRGKEAKRVEKVSVIRSLESIAEADLVLLLLDATQGPTDQDAHVAGLAFNKAKAILVFVNKWDEGKKPFKTPQEFLHRMEHKMGFLLNCPTLFISAKTGSQVDEIFPLIERVVAQLHFKAKTSEVNCIFEQLVKHHPLPLYRGQEIKMYYTTQVGTNPPTFAVFCNYPRHVHFSYKRYLTNALKEAFKLDLVPVRLSFKER